MSACVDQDLSELPERVLDWFGVHGRDLAWRNQGLGRPDPYRVWLCEIIMQQTTLPHGTPYYLAFLKRWPTVEALAAASDDEIMSAWAGLGYYARARNLLKCARELAVRGRFPDTAAGLRKLPGIGPYTAGAIAAIAFGERAAAIDGNVERVFARLLALKGDWKQAKKQIAICAQSLVPEGAPGNFAEGLMDIGAVICMPRTPNCPSCPLSTLCAAYAEGDPARYPIKPKRAKLPARRGHVFLLVDGDDIQLERRPDRGLLGGMLGLPTSEWKKDGTLAAPVFPADTKWAQIGEVRHVFTHFNLRLTVWYGAVADKRPVGLWQPRSVLDGLPTAFAKAAALMSNP